MASARARHCEVTIGGYYKNYKPPRRLLSGFTNLWPKYVLKWALGNRNLHKKSDDYYHDAGKGKRIYL